MPSALAIYKWEALFEDINLFIDGFITTIGVSLGALLLALVLGIIFGICSTGRIAFFKAVSRAYVEFFQNTPILIQIFFFFNGLPYVNIILSPLTIGVTAIGIYHGAYVSEVIRSGIQSVPKGQIEAAESQGFTFLQAMRYVILPQAIPVILPPLTNQAVNLIKNTSLLAVIAGGDLMYQADAWAAQTVYYGPAFIVTGLLYFSLTFPLAVLVKRLEEYNVKSLRAVIHNGGEVNA